MLIKLWSEFTHNTCLLPREMIETISCTVFDTWLTNKAWVKVHTGRLFLCILSCSYFSFHSAIHSSHTDFLLSLSVSCDISWSNIQQQSDTPTSTSPPSHSRCISFIISPSSVESSVVATSTTTSVWTPLGDDGLMAVLETKNYISASLSKVKY